MMKYKYEFEADDFIKGFCRGCPLGYVTSDAHGYHIVECVLGYLAIDCPLEEVDE